MWLWSEPDTATAPLTGTVSLVKNSLFAYKVGKENISTSCKDSRSVFKSKRVVSCVMR